jgi:hypothetical protein
MPEVQLRTIIIAIGLAAVCLLQSDRGGAQSGNVQQAGASADATARILSDKDIELLRRDIRSQKKQLIAANLKLSDSEATKFWPIYDQYTQEQIKINDEKFALIKEYATNWGSMTDDQAALYIRKWLQVDEAISNLRSKYVPIVRGVLSGTKTATFFQLDRRIGMMIDLQLASQIPLVQDQR